jgi:cytochrome c-type biogenesis protein CcmF
MTFLAIAISSTYQIDGEASLAPGQTMSIGGYDLTFNELQVDRDPHRTSRRAMIDVERSGRSVGTLGPALNQYPTQREPMGTPAVKSTLTHDLYLTLMNVSANGRVGIRAIVTPAVYWIWIGVLVMVVGTAVCLVSPAPVRAAP